ncbi:hypothetical protein [Dysgonomonas sp. ZJ709]|uniref:hypothetical protein n=1 Tax=Dysgonomonas sp. ZJ709 TaxID=2709797 RepID=UPI0013EA88AD|nr:hypothetical protein [Dysgonomonas sp. ZJ709]
MRTIYIFIIFYILSVSTAVLKAQSNFKEGYIITNENDSILGLIDFRTYKMNASICRFRKTQNAETQLFHPGEIAKYRFVKEGKYYLSREIIVNDIPRTVFLEYLVQGMMNLYYYVDSETNLEYYYFENVDGSMVPISKKQDETIDNRIKTDERYKGVLNYVFQDYPTMTKDLNKMAFARESMIQLAKEYHEIACTSGEQCIDFENDYKKQFVKIKFSAYSGIQLLHYSLGNEKIRSTESMKSIYPVIGGQVTMSSPRWSKPMSLQLDFSFSGIKGANEYVSGNNYYEKYSFDALMFIGKFGVKYTYPSGKFCPTIEGGFAYSNLFSMSSTFYTEARYNGSLRAESTDDYVLPHTYLVGYYGAVGLDYQIKEDRFIFCRVSYDKYERENDRMKAIQLKIGYIF